MFYGFKISDAFFIMAAYMTRKHATSSNQKESSSSYYYVVRSPKIEKRSYTEDEALTHQKEKTKIDTAIQTYTKTTNTSSSLLSPASLSITPSSSSSSYGNNVKKNNGAYNVKPNVTMNAEKRSNEQNYPSTPNTANEQSDNQERNQYGKEKEKDTDFNPLGQDDNPMSSLNPFGGLFSLGQMGNGGSGF
uniref:Uncharacterized protein n=1 Tax=Schistosoma haematobium TaxID=6185 RepID=A0A094ZTI0_SCHHA